MKTLWRYLRPHSGLVALTLLLAGLAQLLALVDPLIFGRIVDRYVLDTEGRPEAELVRGALGWLLVAAAVAFAARLAGALQDYALRLVTQKLGTEMFDDGLRRRFRVSVPGRGRPQQRGDRGSPPEGAHRHRALRQRVGEHPVRVARRHRLPRLVRRDPALAADPGVRHRRPAAGRAHRAAQPEDQVDPARHRARDRAHVGRDHRVAAQHRAGQEPRPRPAGDPAAAGLHATDLRARDGEGEAGARPLRSAGHPDQPAPPVDPLHPALADLPQRALAGRADLLPVHPERDLRPPAAARERDPQLPRGRGLARGLRAADGDTRRAEAGGPRRDRRDREPALRGRGLPPPRRGPERDRPRLLRGAARRHDRLRGPVGLRQVDAGQAAGRALRADGGCDLDRRRLGLRAALQPRPPADRLRHAGPAAVLGHDPREPAVREAGGQRRGDAGGPAPGLGGAPAGAFGSGTRHAPGRGWRARLGRRTPAPLDRPCPAAPPAALHLRRGHVGPRLDHRAGGHGLAARGLGQPPAHRDPDRPSAEHRRPRRHRSTCWSADASSRPAATTACVEARGLYYAMWRQQIGEREASPPKPRSLRPPAPARLEEEL